MAGKPGGRFTDLPGRLRRGADLLKDAQALDLGDWLAISGTMTDAALKIEALEREAKRVPPIQPKAGTQYGWAMCGQDFTTFCIIQFPATPREYRAAAKRARCPSCGGTDLRVGMDPRGK